MNRPTPWARAYYYPGLIGQSVRHYIYRTFRTFAQEKEKAAVIGLCHSDTDPSQTQYCNLAIGDKELSKQTIRCFRQSCASVAAEGTTCHACDHAEVAPGTARCKVCQHGQFIDFTTILIVKTDPDSMVNLALPLLAPNFL